MQLFCVDPRLGRTRTRQDAPALIRSQACIKMTKF
eukprot:COSAG05_NODE_8911_length_662_cov_0.637655_2_plen_34_part_01